MYIEIAHGLTDRGKIINFSDFAKERKKDTECYISMFPFTKDILDYVTVNKSISGFVGQHYCPVVYLDIDNQKSLQAAYNNTKEVINRLVTIYRVPIRHIMLYFSGCKGFHIGLHENLFGGIALADDIPQRCAAFVKIALPGIQDIDLSVYEPHRLFRVVNSINTKSQLYKIPLTYDEFLKGIEWITDKAKQPRPEFKRQFETQDLARCDKLANLFWSVDIERKEEKQEEIKESVTDDDTDFFDAPAEGNRNNKLFKQACQVFNNSIFTKPVVHELVAGLNAKSETPLDSFEVSRIVNSAYRKTKHNKKIISVVKTDDLKLQPISEYADDWYRTMQPDNSYLKLFIDAFDHDLKHRLRGKLGVFIGYGGTKKSLMAQNIMRNNIIFAGARCMYSSMEMNANEVINRFIDMTVDDTDYNASFELELNEKKTPGVALNIFSNQIAPVYSDKLLLSINGGMTCREYEYFNDKAQKEYGKVDILCVDGLSMMGGNDTEVELTRRHTRELKEYANKTNQLVILMVHVARGLGRTKRDVSELARGGEKIVDNCDFYISFSQCIDFDEATQDNEVYHRNLIYAKFVNKRGSGNHIDKILQLDPKRLLISESDLKPADVNKQMDF